MNADNKALERYFRLSSAIQGEPCHGEAGWDLVRYEWDPRTGNAYHYYERNTGERQKVIRQQMTWHVAGAR